MENGPDNVQVDAKIAVDELVSVVYNRCPGNHRSLLAGAETDVTRCLTEELDEPSGRELQ